MQALRFVAGAATALVAGAVGVNALAGVPAPAPAASAGKVIILKPLSEADQMATQETGCTCSFYKGNATYTQAIGNEFMIRTAAGRQTCRITDAQFQTLSEPKGSMTCGGAKISFKRTGKVTSHMESDSASGPAKITVTSGGKTDVMTGMYGCAC